MFEEIPYTYDTVFDFRGEALYNALYTIADTNVHWREYELKDEIDILLYSAASVYADPDLYVLKGDIWLEMGQADSALNAYSTAYNIAPGDVYASCGMGEAYHAKKEYAPAMEHYNRALEIDSTNIWARSCKTSLLYDRNEFYEALELYNEIVELDQTYYFSYYNRAGVYLNWNASRRPLRTTSYTSYLIRMTRMPNTTWMPPGRICGVGMMSGNIKKIKSSQIESRKASLQLAFEALIFKHFTMKGNREVAVI